MMVRLIPRPPLSPLPMMRPPLPPGPPPTLLDYYNSANQPPLQQKPSYVKSAASTVVKRPLAQHQPELTAMVPALVQVRRETAAPQAKPKHQAFSSYHYETRINLLNHQLQRYRVTMTHTQHSWRR